MESSKPAITPPHFGPALAATFLLRDYENYGLSERVRYHFHLMEVLGDSAALLAAAETNKDYREDNFSSEPQNRESIGNKQQQQQQQQQRITVSERSTDASSSRPPQCGIAQVLECIPSVHHNRLSRQQRSFLKTSLMQLNQRLDASDLPCMEPTRLPVRLNAQTRVSFAYETTRVALLIDASPSMTATFGVSQMESTDDGCCCPMDRLPGMARTLIHALAEQVPLPYRQGYWQPKLSITVLAVYPAVNGDENGDRTSLLVRDWTVSDSSSAETLSRHLQDWVFHTVEEEVASRVRRRTSKSLGINLETFADGKILAPTTFTDWWQAGKAALAALTSAARPCIIVATDGRSVSTDRGLDDPDGRDTPVFILDLSSPVQPRQSEDNPMQLMQSMMQEDPGADFPLYMSDDREALFHISRTTGGCLWDRALLFEAANTRVGQVPPDSPLAVDQYLGKLVRKHQPHMIRPNAVQWYTLFSLSPLSPTFYPHWGHLPPPMYLRKRLADSTVGRPDSQSQFISQSTATIISNDHRRPLQVAAQSVDKLDPRTLFPDQRKSQVRVQFSTYFINPVRILGLLVMRVKEGYRAMRYGQSTHDPDKVSVVLHLSLEMGASLHYEISYRSLSGHNHMVGHAHIKIEVSGEASFIQVVKTDFLQHSAAGQRRPVTLAQQVSAKLGRLLRSIRREDLLQSYLSPIKWSDKLLKGDSPFLRRLGTLTREQKAKHFRYDEFDCVVVGRMPYAQDAGFLDAFQDIDNGEEDLLEAIASWATVRVQSGHRDRAVTFIRKLGIGLDGLPCYCLLNVEQSRIASRLFTVSVEIFEGSSSAPRRLQVLASLREMLARLRDVRVLEMQMGPFLMGFHPQSFVEFDAKKETFVSSQYLHESWDLVFDKELLPLLMRRRAEIGGFWLLDSNESYALFARLHSKEGLIERKRDDPGDMVQYQISIRADRVVVDLHMESECGAFRTVGNQGGQFETLVNNLKRRDQECGLALRARTHMLSVFENDLSPEVGMESHAASALRLLGYSSRVDQYLRAFHPAFTGANHMLLEEFKTLLLAQRFGPRVAILPIDSTHEIQESAGPGIWFLVNYDKDTFGILHIGSSVHSSVFESDGGERTTTTLTFYTLSISDLYSKREDFVVGDDDSNQGTLEEYMCMTDFAEQVLDEYKLVYTRAAYMALVHSQSPDFFVHIDDLPEIMAPLQFCPVADLLIESGGDKLVQILSSVIKEIPGEHYYYYFKHNEAESFFVGTDSISLISSVESIDNDDGDGSQSSTGFESKNGPDDATMKEDKSGSDGVEEIGNPPIFVRFLLDGMDASLEDLKKFRKSTRLVTRISTYQSSDSNSLPISHLGPANQIKRLHNAYVAEQTLERLRHHGQKILSEDLRLARKCLRRARDVLTSAVVLVFYSSTLDTMVSASNPAGGDYDIERGMQLLQNELRQLESLKLGTMKEGSFVVLGREGDSNLLPYWCFLDFGNGIVSIETHHPSGPDHAKRVLSSIHGVIMSQLHKVNQMLILRRLHKNRTATALMIEEDDRDPEKDTHSQNQEVEPHSSGFFACPVVFRKEFELFHRCATNPEQVARTVETSVLHIFSISNRRRVFVYKDESGSIFYMRLSTKGGGLEPDGIIELEVHGIDEPTESVTKQLSRLLSRKILSISVDLLAAVLTKNPRYAWRVPDINFVREYNTMWKEVEEEIGEDEPQTCFYSLPKAVSDPSTILLIFRQNLCGSTFFHPFTSNSSRDEGTEDSEVPSFTFYYNNFPSKLSHKLQGRSTLTKKGAEYARMAGQGLALIDVSLVDSSGKLHSTLRPSNNLSEMVSELDVQDGSIQVRHEDTDRKTGVLVPGQDRLSNHFLKVTITDTGLKRNVLHDWVQLTLDQGISGWCIEKQLERQQRGLLRDPCDTQLSLENEETKKHQIINQIIPGLPALARMFEIANDLPHPAVKKVSFNGIIKSSSVARVALKLLETVIEPIRRETKGFSQVDILGDVQIVRLSRGAAATKVRLSWARDKRSCLVHSLDTSRGGAGKPMVDSHIDCPKYFIFFSSPEYLPDGKPDAFAFPKLFDEVNVGDEYRSELRLSRIKNEMPNTFKRSFGFLLSVKRNSRFILSYNWRPDVFSAVASNLKEEDTSLLDAGWRANDLLQRRSLSFLSPSALTAEPQTKRTPLKREKTAQLKEVPVTLTSEESERKETSRRIVRPVSIRRPKLVGKSVDGSAAHAVAASRARASFKGSYGTNTQAPGPKGNPNTASINTRASIGPRKVRDGRDDSRPSTIQEKRKGKVVKEFRARLKGVHSAGRHHTLHQHVTRSFMGALWPHKLGSPPIPVAGSFLIRQTKLDAVTTAELFPFPPGMFETLTVIFADFLKDSVSGLRIVATSKEDPGLPPTVFLGGEARRMRGLKCFPVLQIDMVRDRDSRQFLLRCSTWTVTLQRPITKGIDLIFQSRQRIETKASGSDKLTAVVRSQAGMIESGLVEFAGKSIMNVMNGGISGLEAVKLSFDVSARYDLDLQIQMLRSEYKIFHVPLMIGSFANKRINHFRASALFCWLLDQAESRNLLVCGPRSLLLPAPIMEMPGIESNCFLSDGDHDKLEMTVICRAKGIDLQRFMFRSGSNIAITIAKNLAIDAAGVAFKELLAAATSLRLHSLWGLASHESLRPHNEYSNPVMSELLDLCVVEPFQKSLNTQGKQRYEELLNDQLQIKTTEMCDSMSLEGTFSPSWTLVNGKRLFYMRSCDIFLLITPADDQRPLRMSFVLKSLDSASEKRKAAAAQQLMNYFLHFLWYRMATDS